jgi:uncharacterized protein (DUF1499 family)
MFGRGVLPAMTSRDLMSTMAQHWWVPTAAVLAGLGLGALLAGRVVSPLIGFLVFTLAAAIGLVFGLGMSGVGLYRLLRGFPNAQEALVAAAGPLVIGLAVLASFLSTPGATRNDVTTDLAEPPVFLTGPAAGLPFPDDFRAWHRATYPDLAPAKLPVSTDAAFTRARSLIEANGWTITAEDRGKGVIQALARTTLFGFEDDILIRVRGSAAESVVDMRSRSRVGRGDRGVNAKRIRDYFQTLGR